jgi:hypothetical protein
VALITNGSTEQLHAHFGIAKTNGVTDRAERGDHPPRLLRRVAASHVSDHGRKEVFGD